MAEIAYTDTMSDRLIRDLERELSNSDNPDTIIRLDKLLRRHGRSADYYGQMMLDRFWAKFDLSDFFKIVRDNSDNHFFLELPDCLGASSIGTTVGVFLTPTVGVGFSPAIRILLGLRAMYHEEMAEALFPFDPQARQMAAYDIRTSGLGPKQSKLIILRDLYKFWIEGTITEEEEEQAFQGFRDDISERLYSEFIKLWDRYEELCSKLKDDHPYLAAIS